MGFERLATSLAVAGSVDAAAIAGYVGRNTAFEEAIADLSMAYADQTARNWRAFQDAIKSGRVVAAET